MEKMTKKICANCKHFRKENDPVGYFCQRNSTIDLVLGTRTPTNLNCYTERAINGGCGPEGVYFEEKIYTPGR